MDNPMEQKAQHTPGPWVWAEDDGWGREGLSPDVIRPTVHERIRVDDANASLIAAAPDLLKDHQGVDETLTFALENGDMPANVRHLITVARDIARAAIAKAKGTTE